MLLLPVILLGAGALLVAYFTYGRFLARFFALNPKTKTPAVKFNDGRDFAPSNPGYLLGQHFSAIAAAGPIVGPITAGLAFGWAPTMAWILLGAIFIGGVHDFTALVASVRHGAKSIAEVVRLHMSRRAYLLFLSFIWISLVYVIIAFTDVTAATFVGKPGPEGDPVAAGVASASMLYLAVAVAMGLVIRKSGLGEGKATALFLPLVFAAIWAGSHWPLSLTERWGLSPVLQWDFLLLAYCFVASLTPVWALLQPRGALGGWFLYATLLVGVLGLLMGGAHVEYPAFLGFYPERASQAFPLFPLLFVTVACGACSGFHSIVSSGTTSKQLKLETHARSVGYGGMLLEGFVALIALSTVMMLPLGHENLKLTPNAIYANGIGGFLAQWGIPPQAAVGFGLLAFATFVYDTLDVCTRLGRYIFQELTGLKGRTGAFMATLATLGLPAYAVTLRVSDAAGNPVPIWRVFWTLFGASNQLLAALTLLGVTVWLKRLGKPAWITGIPAAFMMAMTLWALSLLAKPLIQSWFGAQTSFVGAEAITALALALMAGLVLIEAAAILSRPLKKRRS